MTVRIAEAGIPGHKRLMSVEDAVASLASWDYHCPACFSRVRLHRQHDLARGPAPHFEHLQKNPACPLMK